MPLKDTDKIDCHLQNVGMGSLICRAAKQTGKTNWTNEVDPENCFECTAGKIYREIGCDAVLPNLYIIGTSRGNILNINQLFCKLRKRNTEYSYCASCDLVTAETTKSIITEAHGLFQKYEFYSAYKNLEKAKEYMRDGKFPESITQSISCVESVSKTSLELLNKDLPGKKQITELWKAVNVALEFNGLGSNQETKHLLGAFTNLITQLGGFRNALSDSHGKGLNPPEVSKLLAELAINSAATIATTIVRRFLEIHKGGENE